jgi:hypothetical protein
MHAWLLLLLLQGHTRHCGLIAAEQAEQHTNSTDALA